MPVPSKYTGIYRIIIMLRVRVETITYRRIKYCNQLSLIVAAGRRTMPRLVNIDRPPAPSRLLVDYEGSRAFGTSLVVVANERPRFFFVPEAENEPPPHGSAMAAYRIVLVDAGGSGRKESRGGIVWDSGRVVASAAVGIPCGVRLGAGRTYSWNATYWRIGNEAPSAPATSTFDVGLLSDADWRGTPWLDGESTGMREFRLRFARRTAAVYRARLYASSGGGVTALVNGHEVGDQIGLSAWTAFNVRMMHATLDITWPLRSVHGEPAEGRSSVEHEVVVAIGSGWPSRDGSPTSRPLLRLLLLIEAADGEVQAVHAASPAMHPEGRRGPVSDDSVVTGCTVDLRLGAHAGWHAAKILSPSEVPVAKVVPLVVPPAASWGAMSASSVRHLSATSWHYEFPENLVGVVVVSPSAYSANRSGKLVLEHCERVHLVQGSTRCVPLYGGGPVATDTYLLPSPRGQPAAWLRPRFTWHGFQHVLVRTVGETTFAGGTDALRAWWTTSTLEPSANISFDRGPAGTLFAAYRRMVFATHLSNMAAFVPTDCPTREKHAWLGDALDSVLHAVYALWAPSVWSLFLDTIRDQQVPHASVYSGFVPFVVPAEPPPLSGTRRPGWAPGDLSWTAAYPIVVRTMLLFYGDRALAAEHWPHLAAWADGIARVANSSSHDEQLPTFSVFGDWSCVEPRATCTRGTGPQLAASNYLLALKAMVELASVLGESTAVWRSRLTDGQKAFVRRFWNASLGSFVGDRPPMERQSLASLALAVISGASQSVVPDEMRRQTAEELRREVSGRGHHVTVGATGATHLLTMLSESGAHDDALGLATQASFPGWGYWMAHGATTCWENWSGVADSTHPPEPTHNHIFLCGGLGAWLYRDIGGVRPGSDGYASVVIAPQISRLRGPSAVNTSLVTVRGRVVVEWERLMVEEMADDQEAPSELEGGATAVIPLLRVSVRVPTGVRATLRLPSFGRSLSRLKLARASTEDALNDEVVPNRVSRAPKDSEDTNSVSVELATGAHKLVLTERKPSAVRRREARRSPGSSAVPTSSHARPLLMASLPVGSVPGVSEVLDVYEDVTAIDAPIVFQGKTLRFNVSKRSEAQTPSNMSELWAGRPLSQVLQDVGDLLGNQLLRDVGQLTYRRMAALVPPAIMSARECGDFALGDGQTFVGSRIAAEKHGFSATGAMSYGSINQAFHLQSEELSLNRTRAGLLGGWLPAPFWQWALPNGDRVEQLAFAPAEATQDWPLDVSSPQPVWVRFLNVSASGRLRYVHYVDTYETYPSYCASAPRDGFPTQLECSGEGAAAFYASLLAFYLYWNKTMEVNESAMHVELPLSAVDADIDVAAFARHSIARLMITRRDTHFPRYGAPPQAYGAPMIDGFQDVLCADLATYLEWGLLKAARGVLDNYLSFYLRSRARINYRGPEMAQYGRMLTLVAQYFRQSADAALLLAHAPKLLGVSSMLLQRRRAAQALDRSDPSYGMMRGADESDEVFTAWTKGSTELPHLSFSLEAWRGFRDIGAVWCQLGTAHARDDLVAAGTELTNEVAPLMSDILVAIDRSTVPAGDRLVCHPYVAGERACADMNTEGPPPHARVSNTTFPYNFRASEPWRSYSGMLYSGGLNRTVVSQIVAHNRNRSQLARLGVWSGGPGFDNRLMGFTAQGHAFGLMQHDLVDEALLLLYGVMAHVCSRGTWTCFESRGLPNMLPAGGYATPSQAVVPLLLKWMLVWESVVHPIGGDAQLMLCRGIPRAWLRSGQGAGERGGGGGLTVRNAPTSVGWKVQRLVMLPLEVLSHAVGVVRAEIEMAEMNAWTHAAIRPQVNAVTVALRVRAPDGWRMASVEVDGIAWTAFDEHEETISDLLHLKHGEGGRRARMKREVVVWMRRMME